MIFTLLLGAVAGFSVPRLEPQIRALMNSDALKAIKLEGADFTVLTLIVLLAAAAILAALARSDGGALALIIGAFLGLFGQRIFTAFFGGAR